MVPVITVALAILQDKIIVIVAFIIRQFYRFHEVCVRILL